MRTTLATDRFLRLRLCFGGGTRAAVVVSAVVLAMAHKFLSVRPPSSCDADFQVRILDQESATRAKTRVLIEFYDKVCPSAAVGG